MPPFFFAMSRPHILSDLRLGLWAKVFLLRRIGSTLPLIPKLEPLRPNGGFGSGRPRFVMDLRNVFATNLRRLRHAKELSQGDLAYEAEISCIYLAQLKKRGVLRRPKDRRQPRH